MDLSISSPGNGPPDLQGKHYFIWNFKNRFLINYLFQELLQNVSIVHNTISKMDYEKWSKFLQTKFHIKHENFLPWIILVKLLTVKLNDLMYVQQILDIAELIIFQNILVSLVFCFRYVFNSSFLHFILNSVNEWFSHSDSMKTCK